MRKPKNLYTLQINSMRKPEPLMTKREIMEKAYEAFAGIAVFFIWMGTLVLIGQATGWTS